MLGHCSYIFRKSAISHLVIKLKGEVIKSEIKHLQTGKSLQLDANFSVI